MWVVKLGGSLANSENLPHWLQALTQTGAAIVPGGGPFADAVRKAQARWDFDERTAHDMAILAMRQYGRMLAGLGGLRTGASVDDLSACLQQGQTSIWLPQPETLNAAGVPASWDITSDSLAAWLARQLNAAHLLLIKSLTPPPSETAGEQLIAAGVVDPAFKNFCRDAPFQSWICGRDDHVGLALALRNPDRHFSRIHHE